MGVELRPKHAIDAADDEIDDFHRRVDDAEPFGHLGEGFFEEVLVEFDDHLLPAFGVVDFGGADADAVVEPLEPGVLLLHGLVAEGGQHGVHGQADGVELCELVALEQGVEHGGGDEVLG